MSAASPNASGLIQVFTGNGKGKTTAALGTAIRALARGWRVAFVYFDKGGTHYAERDILASRFSDLAEIFATGLDRIDPVTGKFRFGVTDQDRAEGERGLSIIQGLFRENVHRLVVLDELNAAADLGIVDVQSAAVLIKGKPAGMELILTGRNCPPAFLELADLVSDVGLVKHYFYRGVPARDGLDY